MRKKVKRRENGHSSSLTAQDFFFGRGSVEGESKQENRAAGRQEKKRRIEGRKEGKKGYRGCGWNE